MAFTDWSSRLTVVGASSSELSTVGAAYAAVQSSLQAALDTLVASISNAGLLVMLNTWRSNPGTFGQGFPGGGLPFGTHAAMLTGSAGDDTFAVSAGTGQKLSAVTLGSAFTGQILGGAGQVNQLWTSVTGQLAQLSMGTYAAPYSTAQPILKAEQYTSQTGSGRLDQVGSIYGLASADPVCGVQATGVVGVGIGNSLGANQDTCGVQGWAQQNPLGTLSSPLTTGGPITSLPIVARNAIPAGTYTLMTNDFSGNTQSWVTTGCAAGATSLPVTSQTPNYAYPSGSPIATGSTGNPHGAYFTSYAQLGSSGRVQACSLEAQNWHLDDVGQFNGCKTVGLSVTTAGAPYMIGAAVQFTGGIGDANRARGDSCTFTLGSATVTDSSITAADAGATVFANTFVPTGTIIASVTPGVSFTLAGGITALKAGTTTARISSPSNGTPSAQFQWGILIGNTAPVKQASFMDAGFALNSLQVQGGHAGASLAVGAGNGVAILGDVPRQDTGCTFNSTNTILDTAVVTGDANRPVSGPGIPAGSAIQSVVGATSFVVTSPTIATLSSALSTGGGAITSLPVNVVDIDIPIGSVIQTVSGTNVQQWTTTSDSPVGATAIAVSSQTPNFNYPQNGVIMYAVTYTGSGSVIVGGQLNLNSTSLLEVHTAAADALGAITLGSRIVSGKKYSIDLFTQAGGMRIGVGPNGMIAGGQAAGAGVIQPISSTGTIHLATGGYNATSVVKVGSAAGTPQLAFFGGTLTAQPNGTGNVHTVAAGSTTNVFTNTTFDGSIGSTAYAVGDLVKAMKLLGLLAA